MEKRPVPTPTPQLPAWPLFAGLGPLGALPPVPRLARAFTRIVLASWGLGHLTDDSELVASELSSNVVRAATGEDGKPRYDEHGRLPLLWLRLLSDHTLSDHTGRVRLEVWDTVPLDLGVPLPRQAAQLDESGRGLDIVAELSKDWGWDHIPAHNAKRVWALLAT
jgi:hypothetical protein